MITSYLMSLSCCFYETVIISSVEVVTVLCLAGLEVKEGNAGVFSSFEGHAYSRRVSNVVFWTLYCFSLLVRRSR